jgi:hypothetical protein
MSDNTIIDTPQVEEPTEQVQDLEVELELETAEVSFSVGEPRPF